MGVLMSDKEFFSQLRENVLRRLEQTPFHYYKGYDGTLQCGHLIHPGEYQQLWMLLKFWPTTPTEEERLRTIAKQGAHLRLISLPSVSRPLNETWSVEPTSPTEKD